MKRTIDLMKMIILAVPNDLPVAAPVIEEIIANPAAVAPILGSPAISEVLALTQTETRIWHRERSMTT